MSQTTSRFLELAAVANVSHRVGVRDLERYADRIIARVLLGQTNADILRALASVELRDGYRARPLSDGDVQDIRDFLAAVHRSQRQLDSQLAAMQTRRDRLERLLSPEEPA